MVEKETREKRGEREGHLNSRPPRALHRKRLRLDACKCSGRHPLVALVLLALLHGEMTQTRGCVDRRPRRSVGTSTATAANAATAADADADDMPRCHERVLRPPGRARPTAPCDLPSPNVAVRASCCRVARCPVPHRFPRACPSPLSWSRAVATTVPRTEDRQPCRHACRSARAVAQNRHLGCHTRHTYAPLSLSLHSLRALCYEYQKIGGARWEGPFPREGR